MSTAAAISAAAVAPLAGVVPGVFATGVALGAIAGGYHDIVDVVLGVGVGILAAASRVAMG